MDCRFRELRIKLGMTQEEFRQDFNARYNRNYTPAAISRFENNLRVPEISAIIDFADYFSVSLDYLLNRDFPSAAAPQQPTQEETNLSLNLGRHLPPKENVLLKKYRALSDGSKEVLDATLDALFRQEYPPLEKQIEKTPKYEKRATC